MGKMHKIENTEHGIQDTEDRGQRADKACRSWPVTRKSIPPKGEVSPTRLRGVNPPEKWRTSVGRLWG